MKIKKVLNNNVVLTTDEYNRELVVFGKGIGYGKVVGDIIEKNDIEKSFLFDDDRQLFHLIQTIPPEVIDVTQSIISLGHENLGLSLSSTILLALSDHLNFAINRHKENIFVKSPLHWEVKHLYPKEYETGLKALHLLNEELGMDMPESEASFIALHFINSSHNNGDQTFIVVTRIISKVAEILSLDLDEKIDKSSIDYSRFITHLRYFILRHQGNQEYIIQDSDVLFDMMKHKYKQSYQISENIRMFLIDEYGWDFGQDESVCLMIHIERLKSKSNKN